VQGKVKFKKLFVIVVHPDQDKNRLQMKILKISCFEELGVLSRGPDAFSGAWKSIMSSSCTYRAFFSSFHKKMGLDLLQHCFLQNTSVRISANFLRRLSEIFGKLVATSFANKLRV
jgi:hypothetical protein